MFLGFMLNLTIAMFYLKESFLFQLCKRRMLPRLSLAHPAVNLMCDVDGLRG